MSHLVHWLRFEGGTLPALTERFGVQQKQHPGYPNLVQLVYDQIATPLNDPQYGPMLQECRGIILDTARNYHIVAWPFDKFFNYGEGGAAAVDWATALAQEKLDGSLVIAYHYDGAWHFATRGTPDAGGPLLTPGYRTFGDLIRHTWYQHNYRFPRNTENTLLFELTSPHNRIVIPHKEANLTLLAVRNVIHGQYVGAAKLPAWAAAIGCPLVRGFPLQSIDDIRVTFTAMNPLEQEGYVVVDAQGRRVKVKHPGYVALHHLKDRATPKSFVEVICRGETEELLVHFPDLAGEFNRIKARYDALCTGAAAAFADLHPRCATQKDFALAVQAEYAAYAPILFALRAGKFGTPQAFLAYSTVAGAMRLLGVRDIPQGDTTNGE